MGADVLIDSDLLNRLLWYNPETGGLLWKPRLLRDCASVRSWKMWNTRSAFKPAFTAKHPRGYLIGAIYNKPMIAHRVIWCMVTGDWPVQIDHENGVRHDNRWDNLKNVNNQKNHMNVGIQRNNTSGCPGVSWQSREGRWRARIVVKGHEIGLGYFADYSDAVAVRKQAERDHGFHVNHADRVRNA